MSKALCSWFLVAITSCLLIMSSSMAATSGPGSLVSVQWLEKNLKRDDILLIDASFGQIFAVKHIPGAVNVDLFSFGGRESSSAEVERRFQSWGVSPGKKIVIYDQGGTYMATSLFFDLYYHGFPANDMYLLDGGMAKWQASGGAVTKDPGPAPKPGTFRVKKLKHEVHARLPEFLVASGDPTNNALVEALDPDQHFGAMKFFDRAGHIPNAIMTPSADFFNADKTFKSADEIKRMLAYLGIKPEQQLYTHCGGGVAASLPFFATKIMLSYPKVKLYKGSQLEWLLDERGLPFWSFDAPNMQREKSWLASWGNPMLRQFGVSKLNIVDVRSAQAYQQGHVPYAVNIPADTFKQHLATPGKLAEVLSANGVNVAFETVIVSDGGVNANSALAFLMLEKLGQKKVSVLLNGVDDWGLGEFALTKVATIVGAAKSPRDLAVPATTFPVNVRPGIMIDEPSATAGPYPKVFIASGKNMPTKAQEGKVIHVPYTDLVNANGTPKAAKDIWTLLVKAGLPRYAEIILFADDPGEAAANYFILKSMGYPDVKVLIT